MQFLDVLKVIPYGDGKSWCVADDFRYEYGPDGSGAIITVPQRFITDFASVPRIFWNILPPWGKYGPAAVVHDWLYYAQITTKDQADDVLMEGMKVMGVDFEHREIIYEAVSHAGQSAWNENAKKKEKGFIRIAEELPKKMTDLPFYWEGN